jgi:hypothetical protein
MVMLIAGVALLGAHYFGYAAQIPGVAQIPAPQAVGAALGVIGAVLAILFRRPAD